MTGEGLTDGLHAGAVADSRSWGLAATPADPSRTSIEVRLEWR